MPSSGRSKATLQLKGVPKDYSSYSYAPDYIGLNWECPTCFSMAFNARLPPCEVQAEITSNTSLAKAVRPGKLKSCPYENTLDGIHPVAAGLHCPACSNRTAVRELPTLDQPRGRFVGQRAHWFCLPHSNHHEPAGMVNPW